MNIISKLTVRHLRLNKRRTLITILGIMLSVAMVCAVAGFVMSLRDVMYRTTIEGKGDYHIAYHGVTPETAELIAAEDAFGAYFTRESEGSELLTLYLRLNNPGRDYMEVASGIASGYEMLGVSANAELLALEGVIAQGGVIMMGIMVAAIATVIIVVGSVIVIANAFYISSSERVRQFGLLISVGATKWQIGRSILFEAALLAAIAIPLGIALGFLIQAVVLLVVNGLLFELKSIMIGLPIGVALSYLIYMAVSGVAEFVYTPPYSAMAISAAAVLLLTFGTMRYSRNKMNRVSIVESLRSETA